MRSRALLSTLLAFALAAGAPGQTPAPAEFDQLRPEDLEGTPLDQVLRRGFEHHQAGRLAEAMQDWMELARRRPEGGLGWYNLACAFGLQGNAEQAARFLEAAWKHGFRDLGTADKDSDFDPVRSAPAFKEARARLEEAARKALDERLEGRLLQVSAKAWHPLRVLAPSPLVAGTAYPLVVVLHGAGGSTRSLLPIAQGLASRGFLVCLVEGQYAARDGLGQGSVHFLAKPGPGRKPEEETLRLAEDYVLAAVEAVRRQYLVQPRQTFLAGFSQGAMLTYSLGLRHGDRFRGFIPIAGTVVGELPAKATKGGAWLVFHSPTDAAVTEADHRKAIETLGRLGIEAEVQRYEGGHVVPPAVVTQMVAWMKRMAE